MYLATVRNRASWLPSPPRAETMNSSHDHGKAGSVLALVRGGKYSLLPYSATPVPICLRLFTQAMDWAV